MSPFVRLALAVALVAGCSPRSQTPPQQQPQYGQYPQYPQYPQQPYPPPSGPYPQPYPPPPPGPQPSPQPPPPQQRPLLPPLVGAAMWQQEVRNVMAELIAALPSAYAAKVRGIPLVFDPNPYEVNAFAGCDERGAPFLAGTEGILEAIDAISQTKATDEMLGTHTYDQYTQIVMPQMAKSDKASAALPPGIIPASVLLDPRRLSRAHELYDNIVAFTFGHELGHHYLGHTGCANGQAGGSGPNPAVLGQILTTILPGLNQPNEWAADSAGCVNTLDAGRARQPNYRWTEDGGLMLLDYFSRLESASGISPLNPIGFLRTHPNPTFRIPLVQTVARTWYLQHPS